MRTSLQRGKPLYRQLSEHVEAKILSGELAIGERLPTTKELAEEFGVTVQTAQQGASLLHSRGLIERITGRGTFVSNRISSRTIGIVFGQNVFGNPDLLFFQRLYAEISAQLKQLGWHSNLYFPTEDGALEQMLAELAQDVGKDNLRGIITVCSNSTVLDWAKEHPALPCSFGQVAIPPKMEEDEAYRGISYLIEKGYRNLAIIAHTATQTADNVVRMKASIAAAQAESDVACKVTLYDGDASCHSAGVQHARLALDAPDGPPDAFLVLNDQACRGVIFELLCRQLRIPEDVGMIAKSNRGIEIPCPVALTRLEHSPAAEARTKIKTLFSLIEGTEDEDNESMSKLIVGKSCGE